jgi:hypothetical protein
LQAAKKQAEEKVLEGYLFSADPTQRYDLLSYCNNS